MGCKGMQQGACVRKLWGGWGQRGLWDLPAGQAGWLLLFIQPGRRADFGTPAQSLIKTGHFQGRGMADEYLAWKVEA